MISPLTKEPSIKMKYTQDPEEERRTSLMSIKERTNIASPLDLNSSKSIDQIHEITIETIK
jgi:hypothetical protein